jgi:plastocyanin
MNNNKLILFLVVAVIIVVGAYMIFSRPDQPTEQGSTITDEEILQSSASQTSGKTGTFKEAPYGSLLIEIKGFAYSAPELTIKAGTRVVWVNRDPAVHTVTSTTGLFDSGALLQGQRYERIFDLTGTYDYKSLPHGNDVKGRIRVTN